MSLSDDLKKFRKEQEEAEKQAKNKQADDNKQIHEILENWVNSNMPLIEEFSIGVFNNQKIMRSPEIYHGEGKSTYLEDRLLGKATSKLLSNVYALKFKKVSGYFVFRYNKDLQQIIFEYQDLEKFKPKSKEPEQLLLQITLATFDLTDTNKDTIQRQLSDAGKICITRDIHKRRAPWYSI